ncbi:MarR family transcriptional regulator [Pseudomonas paraeruginosa]|uniref:MarR family transcriptional regulator n=1 Tax=Pseudomonas aeruginosa group TaxID=136841 RepID=UPI00053F07E7|nr:MULTISPECIES: MarR family transcriptional regulator [Pseudomonas aeruginosa group]KAB0746982.1 MarR family transcriptional regulator [Pseudomonas aeruginosa]MBG4068755.1 MarR family transcriptional regulator [Pseudomonas aeruginosa]MBG5601958.1 MarR family transcriptional regulator [Pseudomonas aeruginosa]MBG7006877.1 MarR family transcriptional regulator [Pseudomonas aeruginosa]MBG7026069.1 MarR family transcriptional regulator [Pseudomonas aeruginosa]
MNETNALGLPRGPLNLMTEIVRQRERQLTALLAPLGLGLHEWRALRIIHAFDGDVPMSLLIEHSQTDRTALGRTIERLVQRGWASRLPDPEDGRAVLVRRSRAAQAVFEQALERVARLDEALLASLEAGENGTLAVALGKLLRALDGRS